MMINASVNTRNLIDKSVCDKGSIWNPINCECECEKSCDVVAYLDYENCKCKKKLVDKLANECTENVEEVRLAKVAPAKEGKNKHKCSSCSPYIVLFSIDFTINVGIGAHFVYSCCYSCSVWNPYSNNNLINL